MSLVFILQNLRTNLYISTNINESKTRYIFLEPNKMMGNLLNKTLARIVKNGKAGMHVQGYRMIGTVAIHILHEVYAMCSSVIKWALTRENLSWGGGGGVRTTQAQTSLRIRAV